MPNKKKYFSWLRKKRKNPGSGKLSTSTAKDSTVSYLHQQQSGILSSATFHSSIKTLLYENFVIILTEGELAPLIISGQPAIDDLVSAWENICDEYGSVIKNNRSKSVFDCYKKVVTTQAQIQIIDSALLCLYHKYDADIANVIYEMGYLLITEKENRDEYLKQITRVQTQAKTLVVVLNQYTNEYKILNPEGTLAHRDYQSYMDELAILSKYQGYPLRSKDITVQEYCAIVNSYMAYAEAQKEKR